MDNALVGRRLESVVMVDPFLAVLGSRMLLWKSASYNDSCVHPAELPTSKNLDKRGLERKLDHTTETAAGSPTRSEEPTQQIHVD